MVKAIIMAGGEGTRLRPLTCNRPKPMIPVVNMPVIEYAILLLKRHEIKDITISLFYLPEVVQNYFGDGSDWDVNITYSVEESPLGTAGGVMKAMGAYDDTFVVLSGDGVIDFDITSIIDFHRKKESPFTIVLTRVSQPTEYGIVITNSDGEIEKFLEKPAWSEVFSDTANTGMYIIEPSLMNEYVPKNTKYDFSMDLFPILQENRVPLYGYISDGYWCDVGDLTSYSKVHHDVLEGLVNITPPGKQIHDDVYVGKDVFIHPEAVIHGPVFIGDFVKIKKGAEVAESSSIGNNCVIEENASVRKSIILNSTIIGPKSELRGAVIGKRCVIDQNVSVYEGAVVSDDCTIEKDATISSGIRIWPDKLIEQKSILTTDFIWGRSTSKTLFGTEGILGTFNVKITPEFASKLGAALGAFTGKDSQVVIGRDNSSAARIIKRSLTAGLLSMGTDVYDMEVESLPVNRYSARYLNAEMGIYIQVAPLTNLQNIILKLFNNKGFQIPLKSEKKIENIFYRGDYPRKNVFETGDLFYPTHHIESYMTNTENYISGDILREKKWKIIADCFFGTASYVYPELLTYYGCEVTVLRGQLKNFTSEESMKENTRDSINNITQMAQINKEIGIIIGPTGSNINIIDESGSTMLEEDIMALLSIFAIKYRNAKIINIPTTASSVLEKSIIDVGGRVNRVGSNVREAENVFDIFTENDNGVYPYLQFAYDPMITFLQLLELLTREKKKLVEIRENLPKSNLITNSIHCTTDEKASIMRKLTTKTGDHTVELKDGLKVIEEHAWILILPDAAQPLIHIHAEGDTIEARDEIMTQYVTRIKRFKQNPSGN